MTIVDDFARPTEFDDRYNKGVGFFCRHLVGLCFSYRYKDGTEADQTPRFVSYSGILIRINNSMHFLTSGHVLEDIEKHLRGDQVEIANAVLADTLGSERVCDRPIPFDLKSARFFYIDDEELGLDFGLMSLDRHYVRLLAKNGVVALAEENWIHQSQVEFDGYAMLGLPQELTSSRLDSEGNGHVSSAMLGVKRLSGVPAGKRDGRYPWFVGQIGLSSLTSIKGMSGGPIFGFRREANGQYRYWIVALQSRWDPETCTIYGCSLPILASLVTQWASDQAPAA